MTLNVNFTLSFKRYSSLTGVFIVKWVLLIIKNHIVVLKGNSLKYRVIYGKSKYVLLLNQQQIEKLSSSRWFN